MIRPNRIVVRNCRVFTARIIGQSIGEPEPNRASGVEVGFVAKKASEPKNFKFLSSDAPKLAAAEEVQVSVVGVPEESRRTMVSGGLGNIEKSVSFVTKPLSAVEATMSTVSLFGSGTE